jgi:hypothetical protein
MKSDTVMREIRQRSTRNGLLSDDAILGASVKSLDGGGSLGCGLGLGVEGEEGEEGIH